MKIKICKKFNNLNKLQNKLSQAFPNDTIIIEKCLSMCKVCKHQPVAKIKGAKIKSSRISELITQINKKR